MIKPCFSTLVILCFAVIIISYSFFHQLTTQSILYQQPHQLLQLPTLSSHNTFSCSNQTAASQAAQFIKQYSRNRKVSACPKTTFLEDLAEHKQFIESEQYELVLVDVGANKGYTSAKWFSTFTKNSEFTPSSLHRFLKNEYPRAQVLCGVCGDCKDHYTASPDRLLPKSLTVYAIEASPTNFAMLKKIVKSPTLATDGKMKVFHYAASDSTGSTVKFSHADPSKPGLETGSIIDQKESSIDFVEVPSIALDNFFARQNLNRIDILKIDTEGFDPMVIRGATQTLMQNKAKVLMFEYHHLNLWSKDIPNGDSLKKTVQVLDLFGYDCYLDGRDSMFRLTGCWDDRFEFRWWSNVVCTSRKYPEIGEVMMKLSKYIEE